MQLRGYRETLRPQFQQKAVAAGRVKNAAGPGRSFDKKNFDARFLERIRANQPRNAAANHQSLSVTGHDEGRILAGSKSFRKKRLGGQLLFFQIRIKKHSQVANENAAEPGGADFAILKEHQPIVAERLETA